MSLSPHPLDVLQSVGAADGAGDCIGAFCHICGTVTDAGAMVLYKNGFAIATNPTGQVGWKFHLSPNECFPSNLPLLPKPLDAAGD